MGPQSAGMSDERTGARPPGRALRRSASASTVLRAVLAHGPVSRGAIARITGLSAASVTGHAAELFELGLIRETSAMAGPNTIGRPHVPLDLSTDRHVVCGVHVAVPQVTTALLDLGGRVLVRDELPHADPRPEVVLERVVASLEKLLSEHAGGRTPLGIGVATGGWVDKEAGVVVTHPVLGWRDVPLRDRLVRRTGLPVDIDSHSRALVHAERLFGQARSKGSVLSLFVGNVVDAAFAIGDLVHHGPGSQAGAIGHIPIAGSAEPCECGRIGCLQGLVSERALTHRAVEAGIIDEPAMLPLLEAAVHGNAHAVELFLERARLIGQAVAMLLDVLNPELVVIIEAGVIHLPGCIDALRGEVRARSWVARDPRQTVVVTSFPDDVLATAGGAVLLDALYRDPLGVLSRSAAAIP